MAPSAARVAWALVDLRASPARLFAPVRQPVSAAPLARPERPSPIPLISSDLRIVGPHGAPRLSLAWLRARLEEAGIRVSIDGDQWGCRRASSASPSPSAIQRGVAAHLREQSDASSTVVRLEAESLSELVEAEGVLRQWLPRRFRLARVDATSASDTMKTASLLRTIEALWREEAPLPVRSDRTLALFNRLLACAVWG